jgi:hypothetical protein
MGTYSITLKGIVPPGVRKAIAILNAQRKLKFGFPYTLWDRTPNIGGYDKGLLMYDYRKKPQSIQYPPGMEPNKPEKFAVDSRIVWTYADGVGDGVSGVVTWSYNRDL